jgi:hypothetical protein
VTAGDGRLCPQGHPMRVELRGKLVGSREGHTVTLWYCEACDHAEHEVVREA